MYIDFLPVNNNYITFNYSVIICISIRDTYSSQIFKLSKRVIELDRRIGCPDRTSKSIIQFSISRMTRSSSPTHLLTRRRHVEDRGQIKVRFDRETEKDIFPPSSSSSSFPSLSSFPRDVETRRCTPLGWQRGGETKRTRKREVEKRKKRKKKIEEKRGRERLTTADPKLVGTEGGVRGVRG